MYALEIALFDRTIIGIPSNRFRRQLIGFESIVNLSVPVAGNFTLLRRLREERNPFRGSPAPAILEGVTYVEHLAGHPNTLSTCQLYYNKVVREVDYHRLNRPRSQQNIINAVFQEECAAGMILWGLNPVAKATMVSLPWAAWLARPGATPNDKGPGVRAPDQ